MQSAYLHQQGAAAVCLCNACNKHPSKNTVWPTLHHPQQLVQPQAQRTTSIPFQVCGTLCTYYAQPRDCCVDSYVAVNLCPYRYFRRAKQLHMSRKLSIRSFADNHLAIVGFNHLAIVDLSSPFRLGINAGHYRPGLHMMYGDRRLSVQSCIPPKTAGS